MTPPRVFPLAEAQKVLRELGASVAASYDATPADDGHQRRALARQMVALEMGAQALAAAEVEERKKPRISGGSGK